MLYMANKHIIMESRYVRAQTSPALATTLFRLGYNMFSSLLSCIYIRKYVCVCVLRISPEQSSRETNNSSYLSCSRIPYVYSTLPPE